MLKNSVVKITDLCTILGGQVLHDHLNLEVFAGELVALIGPSGTGKSVLMRELLGLMEPTSGRIDLLGIDIATASEDELASLRSRIGMLFQEGALFSSLTVAENVAVPIREKARVPEHLIGSLVSLRLAMAGLSQSVAQKMPSELSGGMRKRAAIARALALEPEVLFLDEPTAGLDPVSARSLDSLLLSLQEDLGITVVLVTHDLDTLLTIPSRIVALGKGKVIADGSIREIMSSKDSWIHSYFSSRASFPPESV